MCGFQFPSHLVFVLPDLLTCVDLLCLLKMSVEIPVIEAPKPRKFIKKPDVEQKNKQIKELDTQIKKIEAQVTLLSSQIETTVTPKVDTEKRQELTAELRKIINSQNDIKKKRESINQQIRLLDQSIKKKVGEITSKTFKYNFKTTEDIDKRIRKIESDIESGNLMLVEEKKALKEMSSLNKLKKDFAGIEQIQKSIDSDKAKIAELKASLSTVSNKEAQAKFEEITNQLNELTEKNKGIQAKRDELFGKRRVLQNEKYELLKQIRKIRDDFDAKFKKFKADMDNERKKREEEEKAYRLYIERNDLMDEIKEIESSASTASNELVDQIKAAIVALDPEFKFDDETSALDALESTTTSSQPAKSVEAPQLDESLVIKKEEVAFVSGSTKGKKSKKNNNKKQNKIVDPSVITKLTYVGATIPASKDEYPKVIDELKAKLETAKKEQGEAAEKAKAEAAEKITKIKEQISGLEKEILQELEKEKERQAAKRENASKETEEAEKVEEA